MASNKKVQLSVIDALREVNAKTIPDIKKIVLEEVLQSKIEKEKLIKNFISTSVKDGVIAKHGRNYSLPNKYDNMTRDVRVQITAYAATNTSFSMPHIRDKLIEKEKEVKKPYLGLILQGFVDTGVLTKDGTVFTPVKRKRKTSKTAPLNTPRNVAQEGESDETAQVHAGIASITEKVVTDGSDVPTQNITPINSSQMDPSIQESLHSTSGAQEQAYYPPRADDNIPNDGTIANLRDDYRAGKTNVSKKSIHTQTIPIPISVNQEVQALPETRHASIQAVAENREASIQTSVDTRDASIQTEPIHNDVLGLVAFCVLISFIFTYQFTRFITSL